MELTVYRIALTAFAVVLHTGTALCLLAAGALFIAAVKHSGNPSDLKAARWPALLLGLALILGAGEELSWGQHWFGFETPKLIKNINPRGELNLHNIDTALVNHLMVFFLFFYVGLLPILTRIFVEIRYIVKRLAIPLCPLQFVPFAFTGCALIDYNLIKTVWGNPLWNHTEPRETLFGMIMLDLAILFYTARKKQRSSPML